MNNTKQIAKLVSHLTNKNAEVLEDQDITAVIYDDGTCSWLPSFEGEIWQIAQAAQLVRWINTELLGIEGNEQYDCIESSPAFNNEWIVFKDCEPGAAIPCDLDLLFEAAFAQATNNIPELHRIGVQLMEGE